MQQKARETPRPEGRVFLLHLLVLAIALCLAPATAFAGPALEVEQSYAQPDGATFQAGQRGDEYFHYVRTTDGFLVQKSPADQTWYYVTDAGSGFAFGPRADGAVPENALTPSVLANDAGKRAYAALGGGTYTGASHETGDVVTLSDIESVQGSSDANANNLLSAAQTKTSLPLITIVIGFESPEGPDATIEYTDSKGNKEQWPAAEQRYRDDYDWHDQLYGSDNSITNYYATMSNGKFAWAPAAEETSEYGKDGNTNKFDQAGDGSIHVTLDRNHGNWKAADFKSPEAADQRAMYVDALNEASKYIDFATYDVNHDGTLEKTEAGLLFVMAGYEASAGYNVPATWAVSWDLSSMDKDNFKPETITNPQTGSEVTLDSYITMGETFKIASSDSEGHEVVVYPAQRTPVSTVAHELGHYLGLPDLYDVRYSANSGGTVDEYPWIDYDVYATSLMASGSWGRYDENGVTVFTPVGLDPYCLAALEYIEPVDVTSDGTYDVSAHQSSEGYRCLRIPASSEGEYYLVENRQYEGFDKGLTGYYRQAGHKGNPNYYNETGGIVVWHIDQGVVGERDLLAQNTDIRNTVNTVDHRPGVMPVYLEGTPYHDGLPMKYRPYYNAAVCTEFGLADDVLPLLLYDGCETPAGRVDSGISLTVGDAAGDTMSVTVDLPEEYEPSYEERTLAADLAGAHVEVSGAFSANAEAVIALSALADEQIAKLATASDQLSELITGANVSVVDATTGEDVPYTGALSASFSVDASHEGETVWMVHQKTDGSLETTKAVVQNGRASMTVDELSPFAVFEQKAEIVDDGASGAQPSVGNDGSNVKELPRSGDGDAGIVLAGLALAAATALAATRARLRRSD